MFSNYNFCEKGLVLQTLLHAVTYQLANRSIELIRYKSAMDQHPVPQNISSYEFRLVGDMTLKQFFQLAGGGILALIFYRIPFPFFIKWPLIFISVLGGILLAFVPLNGRPFSQWILAFFKAVYSPTEFFWSPLPATSPSGPVIPQSVQPIAPPSPLDKLESQLVDKFSNLFDTVSQRFSPSSPLPFKNPSSADTAPQQPDPAPPPPPTQVFEAAASPILQTPPPPPRPVNPFPAAASLTPTIGHSPLTGTPPPALASSLFVPSQPNILCGVVTDSLGQVMEGAILEIAEKASGLPVRALKSNKLGQFQIATPLPSGEYVITTEKDGYLFDPLLIVTQGEIIQPFEVRAKAIS